MVSDINKGTWTQVFANRVLRRIFGLKIDERWEVGEICITGRFIACIFHQVKLY
jgi:hypothetical protein